MCPVGSAIGVVVVGSFRSGLNFPQAVAVSGDSVDSLNDFSEEVEPVVVENLFILCPSRIGVLDEQWWHGS